MKNIIFLKGATMNPIEEMMEKYGVIKGCPCDFCDRLAAGDQIGYSCNGCSHCGEDKEIFPTFTAEKQLGIIKLIGLLGNVCLTKRMYHNNNWCITTHHKNGIGENQDFSQALAQLTINLLEAGESDKQQIKEILER